MPILLHLSKDQTMELIKDGGLKVELTDDQAIEVASQLGQLLGTRQHLEHHTPVYKVRRTARFRRIQTRNGGPTLASKIYEKINTFEVGRVFTATELGASLELSIENHKALWNPLHRLKKARRIKKLRRGTYEVI